MMKQPFIVLDLETTGVNPHECGIVQVTAQHYSREGTLGDEYTTLVHPHVGSADATAFITGITSYDTHNAPETREVLDKLRHWLAHHRGAVYAHNGLGFDFIVLDTIWRDITGIGEPYIPKDAIDTLAIARFVYPMGTVPNHKLATLAWLAGWKGEQTHRSDEDCAMLAYVMEHLLSPYFGMDYSPHVSWNYGNRGLKVLLNKALEASDRDTRRKDLHRWRAVCSKLYPEFIRDHGDIVDTLMAQIEKPLAQG